MRRENKQSETKPRQKLFKYQYNAKKMRRISSLLDRAQTYLDDEQFQQANLSFQQVLKSQPDCVPALIGLGDIALQSGMTVLALDFYKYAYDISPSDLMVNEKMAAAYVMLERYDDAIFHYLYVLHEDEDNAEIHGKLAVLNEQIGNNEIAIQHYLVALENNPEQPLYLEGIMNIDPSLITDEHIRKVEMNLAENELTLENRCGYYFLLGHIYDATGRYDQAFANYKVANICKAAEFDVHRFEHDVTKIIDLFDREFIKAHSRQLSTSDQPVFLIGTPGSGVRHLDQLLDNHHDVFSAGEIASISDIAAIISRKVADDRSSIISAHDSIDELLNNYARYYLNQINTIASDSGNKNPLRVIDRHPNNFLHVGLITMLFPQATIILCQRDPLESALACYFEHFTQGNLFSYDLTHIVAYMRQYQRLLTHWENVMPGKFYRIEHEDVVNFPRMTAKEISEVLDIDSKKFNFSPIDGRPQGRSSLKRKPGMVSAIELQDRWKNYERQAAVLKQGLSEVLLASSSEADAVQIQRDK